MRNYLANEHDYTKLPAKNSINRADADALFKLFDEGSDFILGADGQTWTYKGVLRYRSMITSGAGTPFGEQHRIAHVLHHSIDNAVRTGAGTPHGVFTVPQNQIFDILHDVRSFGTSIGKDFEYTFGSFVGKANNSPVSGNGLPLIPYQQTKKVRLWLRAGTNDVNTAFPKN